MSEAAMIIVEDTPPPVLIFVPQDESTERLVIVDAAPSGGTNITNSVLMTAPGNPDNLTLLEQNDSVFTYYTVIDGMRVGYSVRTEAGKLKLSFMYGQVPAFSMQKSPGEDDPVDFSFNGQVSGQDGTDPSHYATVGQVEGLVNARVMGGYYDFMANGSIMSFDIEHGMDIDNEDELDADRFRPRWFTLVALKPIPQNQLSRSITFPNANTMRITFENAPITGEDNQYCWSVTK